MFDRNRSGQFLYFNLVSALSGNPVTGQVTGISGRLSIDGAAQAVIAGTLGETGGGQYQANLFAADVNGNNLGFLFTASGCVPVSFTVVTQQNVSGRIFAASGVNATVSIASISGVNPASGAFVTVLPANLSGVIANSGLFVTVPKATISGVIANSGLFTTVLPENLSGVVTNSGLTVTVIKETISGVIANSGLFVTVLPANLSGMVVNSGLFVTVLPTNLSGVVANSGLFVTVPIETISGTIPASGGFVTVPKATLSGVVANSGLFTVATTISGTTFLASGSAVNLLSGNVTSPYSGSLSGQFVNAFSGAFGTASLNSGQQTLLYSGQLSGQQVTARTVTDKSGYILSNSGLDLVNVESGMNFRQAQAVIAAAAGGQLSGAGTATINIDGANVSGTTRITASVNASGNRTAITLNLPG